MWLMDNYGNWGREDNAIVAIANVHCYSLPSALDFTLLDTTGFK